MLKNTLRRIMRMWSRCNQVCLTMFQLSQVWQRGEGEGCEVYVKFKDKISVQRFLTLNYVRYRTRPITVSPVVEKEDLAEYLSR